MKLVKAHAAQPCATACCRYKMQKQTLGHISILTGVFPKAGPTCSPRGKIAGGVDFVPGWAPGGVWGIEFGGWWGLPKKKSHLHGIFIGGSKITITGVVLWSL